MTTVVTPDSMFGWAFYNDHVIGSLLGRAVARAVGGGDDVLVLAFASGR